MAIKRIDDNGKPYPVYSKRSFWENKAGIVSINQFEGKIIEVKGIYKLELVLGLQKLKGLTVAKGLEELNKQHFIKIEES